LGKVTLKILQYFCSVVNYYLSLPIKSNNLLLNRYYWSSLSWIYIYMSLKFQPFQS